MDVIIYRKIDGGVALGLIYNAAGQLLCNPQVEGARVVAASPDLESFRVGKAEDIPGITEDGRYDKYFFEAFTDENPGSQVDIDMPKAREIHMNRIREMRDKELAKLDIEQLKGNDVAVEKQTLRDIPQVFDLAFVTTPTALKKLWPSGVPLHFILEK